MNRIAILCANNELSSLEGRIASRGDQLIRVDPHQAWGALSMEWDAAIIDTREDVAELCRLVYELYRQSGAAETVPVIAVVSMQTIDQNPRLGAWEIDGHPAVLAVVPRSNQADDHVLAILDRMVT